MAEGQARRRIGWGEHAPWFTAQALDGLQNYAFSSVAGRHILLLFFGSAGDAASVAALRLVAERRGLFDDDHLCFYGVTTNPADVLEGRIAQSLPGIRYFLDYNRAVGIRYGADAADDSAPRDPYWLLLDPQLRVAGAFDLADGAKALAVAEHLSRTPPPADAWAPVLSVPRVFEPGFCKHLIELYDRGGGTESGFMREENGKTVYALDHAHKRRADYQIEDNALRQQIAGRIRERLIPGLRSAFQFTANRMERYIVARYDGTCGGYFRPHRDNTTKGTAHRRFAVTINLNADYEGGDLRFPEFGQRTYRAPVGGAVVFSCSLLHEARPVTTGLRYAFLPFLYDDAAAQIREANNEFLDPSLTPYRAGLASG